MPVLFEENRKRDSSAEKPAPRTPVTFMNCSIVYCFEGRAVTGPGGVDCAAAWEAIAASATSVRPARINDRDMRTPSKAPVTGRRFPWEAPILSGWPVFGSRSATHRASVAAVLPRRRRGPAPVPHDGVGPQTIP